MQWLVLTPLKNIYAPGALAGDYVGASAEVTAAVGAGANLLVGGSKKSLHLAAAQPADADRAQRGRGRDALSAAVGGRVRR